MYRYPTNIPTNSPSNAPSRPPTFECLTLMVDIKFIINHTQLNFNISIGHVNGHYIYDGIFNQRPKWIKNAIEDPMNQNGY